MHECLLFKFEQPHICILVYLFISTCRQYSTMCSLVYHLAKPKDKQPPWSTTTPSSSSGKWFARKYASWSSSESSASRDN